MTLPTFYTTGTVSVTNGATAVTGAGTGWGGDVILPGDLFMDPAQPGIPPQRIASVTDGTHIVLATAWPGTTMAAAAYEVRFVGIVERSTAQSRRYLEMIGQLSALGIQPGGFGEYADRADFDTQPKGFIFLSINGDAGATTSAWTLYVKLSNTSGDWDAGQTMEGAPGPQGDKGWAPVHSIESDGARRVEKLLGYVGGAGSAPTENVGKYRGPAGYVTLIGAASDVRGPSGPANTLAIGAVTSGPAAATLTGAAPSQQLNLVLPPGADSTVPGPVGVNWRGDYNGATAYAVRDGALDNGSSWRCISPTTGNAPPTLPTTSNTWWTLIAAKGADGLGVGDVVGPTSAANNRVAVFDGTTGKLLKDSGVALGTAASKNTGTSSGQVPVLDGSGKLDTSVVPIGTAAGTVAAGDDSRITGAVQSSILTTRGDILVRGASAPARLGIGATDRLFKSDGTDPSWGQLTAGMVPNSLLTFAMLASGALASNSEMLQGTASKLLSAAILKSAVAYQTLTDATNIAWDMAGGNNATVVLGGNRTGSNITNATPQFGFVLKLTATGATRTWTPGNQFVSAVGVEAFPISILTTETVFVVGFVDTATRFIITGVIRT